jgi:hypothetical protein
VSLGPITIYDKSTLESLSLDEAVWFGNFYRPNVTPLFFVETLADLEKEVAEGRTPEQVVGNIAAKSVIFGPDVNVYHGALCIGELLGHKVEMRGVPVIGGGHPFDIGGERGVLFKQAAEVVALQRWQEGQFLEVERGFAAKWREMLAGLDLGEGHRRLKSMGMGKLHIRDLAEAKAIADELVRRDGWRYSVVKAACALLGIPGPALREITARWEKVGRPALPDFAPFTAHVLMVDLFFYLGLLTGHISKDRPSNRVDIAYLYYLPFCMVFVSNDNLHARCVPLFLGKDQEFIRGQDLKADLSRLDGFYSALPGEVREQGVMKFAHYPPADGGFLTTRLWDRFLPKWRENAANPWKLSPESGARLVAEVNAMAEAAQRGGGDVAVNLDKAKAVIISRQVPVRMGKWRLLPPEVEQGGR